MSTSILKKDVVVLGGGPAGYVAAIRLGQLGKSVALIDRGTLGGVCLNWGCIPSKALIHIGKLYEQMQHADAYGISTGKISIDLKKAQAWKKEVVGKLTGGVAQLLKASGVEVIKGVGKFAGAHRIAVEGVNSGKEAIEFGSAIVAVGSKPIEIPGFAIDGKNVVDSQHALDWTKAPKRMLIIGGGVIGMEIGMLYQKFGTQVTVVEMLDQLLPGTDTEVAQTLARICRQRKIECFVSSKALGYAKKKTGLSVDIQTPKGKETVACDVILLSVGRSPNGKGLGLEQIGVQVLPNGTIPVNRKLQTNVPHIYAIGDVNGPPLLAHKGSKEGIVAAEIIAGLPEEYDVGAMPAATFTDPEIASVGLTETDARKRGLNIFIGKFPFAALGRAVSTGHPEGFVKVIGEQSSRLILGVHIIGAGASDLISEAALAIEMGATVEDLALTVHPHPTMSESLMEAAEAALGHAIHTANRPATRSARTHELT